MRTFNEYTGILHELNITISVQVLSWLDEDRKNYMPFLHSNRPRFSPYKTSIVFLIFTLYSLTTDHI